MWRLRNTSKSIEDLRGNISFIKLHENIVHKNEIYYEDYIYVYICAKFISIRIKIDFKFIVNG